jgi:hypothetical protein
MNTVHIDLFRWLGLIWAIGMLPVVVIEAWRICTGGGSITALPPAPPLPPLPEQFRKAEAYQ